MNMIKRFSLLAILLIMLFSLIPFAPPSFNILNLGDLSVDRAFILALPYFLSSGIQYGPDVVFTYGPWGILISGVAQIDYMPFVWVFNTVYCAFVFLVFMYYLEETQNTLSKLVVWFGFFILVFLWITGQNDSYFSFPTIFIAFAYFSLYDRKDGNVISFKNNIFSYGSFLMLLGNFLLGWTALAKFNIFILASFINAMILIVDLRRGRFPTLPLMFVTSVITAWIIAGQKLANLPTWISDCLNLSSGYSDAMAKGFLKPYSVFVVSALYFGIFLIILTIIRTIVFNRKNRDPVFLFFFLLLVCAVSIKHAFGGNQIEQSIADLLTISWFLAIKVTSNSEITYQATIFSRVSLIGAFGCLALVASFVNFPILGIKDALSNIKRNIIALPNLKQLQLNHGWSFLLTEAHKLAPIKNNFPGKTIDIYPQHTGVVIGLKGITYDPRPAYLSLNAHTLDLVNANARHLEGRHAPDLILFQVLPPQLSVNNRYPAIADGPSWPLILSRYDLISFSGDFLILKKRLDRIPFHQDLIVKQNIRLGEQVIVPSTDSGLVWAEIKIRRTIFGKLIHMVYKSPHILILIHTKDGIDHTYQILPELGRAGFLLSPFVKDTYSFAEIEHRNLPTNDKVEFFKIISPGSPKGFWGKKISIRLFELSISSKNIPILSSENQRLLTLQLLKGNTTSCQSPPKFEQLTGKNLKVLAFHAPCQTNIPVSSQNHSMTILFGLQDNTFSSSKKMNGVILQVIAKKSDGEVSSRWEEKVDPTNKEAVQGTHKIGISWSDGSVRQIIIKILPSVKTKPIFDDSYIQAILIS